MKNQSWNMYTLQDKRMNRKKGKGLSVETFYHSHTLLVIRAK